MNASAGVARLRADSVFGGAAPIGLLYNIDGRYTSATRVGLGVQYDFNRSLGVRFGVERFRNLNGSGTRAAIRMLTRLRLASVFGFSHLRGKILFAAD